VKAKLGVLARALVVVVLELALFYPIFLLDQEISSYVVQYTGSDAAWVLWTVRVAVWSFILFGSATVYFGAQSALKRWRRTVRTRRSLALVAGPSKVDVIGSKDKTDFCADALVKLAVPDAIAAIDRRHGLLRLKSIEGPQDCTIHLGLVIGMEFRPGEERALSDRQARFRHYDPKFRTLGELPSVHLEIATHGRAPVLEYFLFADVPDAKQFEVLVGALNRAVRSVHARKLPPTEMMLDALPVQGDRYGFGWIADEAARQGKSLETKSSARNSLARFHALSSSPRKVIVRS
jgi:hypothetical protein